MPAYLLGASIGCLCDSTDDSVLDAAAKHDTFSDVLVINDMEFIPGTTVTATRLEWCARTSKPFSEGSHPPLSTC